jgi:hypothetical protein
MTSGSTDSLLRQEVQELTQLLRSDPAWEDLRGALSTAGFTSAQVVLLAFYEDETGHEYGLLLTAASEFMEFKRSTSIHPEPAFAMLRVVSFTSDLSTQYPTASVGLAVLRDLCARTTE